MTNTCKSVIRAYNFGPKTGGTAGPEGHWERADRT
jgi:hypothetical protein